MQNFLMYKTAIVVLLVVIVALLTFLITSKVCRTKKAKYILELIIPLILVIIMHKFATWFQPNDYRNVLIFSGLTLLGLSLCIMINHYWSNLKQLFNKSATDISPNRNDTEENLLKWIHKK